jgi:hypothetical protein
MGFGARSQIHFLIGMIRQPSSGKLYMNMLLKHTVLVNNVCGQVPHKKFRQTLSSDQTRLTLTKPMVSGPIICCMGYRGVI